MTTESTAAYECLQPPLRDGDLGRLGPYYVVGLLGQGGMGQVFEAQDSRLMRPVALKMMNERIAASPNCRKRFIEEARAMAAVRHDNVATIFEVNERAGTPFMAMELLRGETLAATVGAQHRWSASDVIRLATEVTRGLAAAHAAGIIHRDVKPANLWLEAPSGRVKILDFGLALAGTGMNHLVVGGAVVGTPGYLAPEQARNEPLDDRTDLYSLGVVLYELCTGQLPLIASTVVGQLIAILAHEPRPIRELNRDIPEPLAKLIHQLLSKEPRHRPRSAKQLESMLADVSRECEQERHAAVQIVTSPTSAPPSVQPSSRSTRASSRSTRAGRAADRPLAARPGWRKRLPWGLSAAALLIAVPLLGWALSGSQRVAGKDSRRELVSKEESTTQPVLAANLKPLALTKVLAGSDQVEHGEAARFRMGLTNGAEQLSQDPRRIHADAQVVAQVVCYLKRPGQLPRKAPAFPKRLAPVQLPAPGEGTEIEMQFITSKLPRETFEIIFELQSPAGAKLGSVSSELTIIENLRDDDLLGFERLRTHAGRGADTHVRKGAEKTFGDQKAIHVHHRPNQVEEHAYLRFDLEKSPVPAEEIDRAVLLMTVHDGGLLGRSVLNAYGVPESIAGDWAEHGPQGLRFENAPSGGGVERLMFLGQVTIDNRGGDLKHVQDGVRIVSSNLDDFLRNHTGSLATIALVRENGANKPTRLSSKEGKPDQAPALALRRRSQP